MAVARQPVGLEAEVVAHQAARRSADLTAELLVLLPERLAHDRQRLAARDASAADEVRFDPGAAAARRRCARRHRARRRRRLRRSTYRSRTNGPSRERSSTAFDDRESCDRLTLHYEVSPEPSDTFNVAVGPAPQAQRIHRSGARAHVDLDRRLATAALAPRDEQLLVPGDGRANGRDDVARAKRLDEVGEDAGADRTLDEQPGRRTPSASRSGSAARHRCAGPPRSRRGSASSCRGSRRPAGSRVPARPPPRRRGPRHRRRDPPLRAAVAGRGG